MSKEKYLELKVGGFVILALVCLTIFILTIGDFSQFQEGNTYRLIFNYAGGVKVSSPVRVAGVELGQIRKIGLFYDREAKRTKVAVLIWLQDGTRIPTDSRVLINQLGLFGEKYIEIMPGVDTQHFFKDGDEIIGVDPVLQEEVMNNVVQIADKMGSSLEGISVIVNDQENQQSLKTALKRLSEVSAGFQDIVDQVREGKGTIGRLLMNSGVADDLQSLSADLKENPWKLLYRPPAAEREK